MRVGTKLGALGPGAGGGKAVGPPGVFGREGFLLLGRCLTPESAPH